MGENIATISPPFEELETFNTWYNVTVQAKGKMKNGQYDIKQNGPFLFFIPRSPPHKIEFLIFTLNYEIIEEGNNDIAMVRLEHIYDTDIFHLLILNKDNVKSFIDAFKTARSELLFTFSNLRYTECQLENTMYFSCLSNTNQILESKIGLSETLDGAFNLNCVIKTRTGWDPKLDIKLSANTHVEPALTAPDTFGTAPQLAHIFHVKHQKHINDKPEECFVICTSIETLMHSVLSIAKWALDASKRPRISDSSDIFNLNPRPQETPQPKTEPTAKPSLLTGLFSKIKQELKGDSHHNEKPPQPVQKVPQKGTTPEIRQTIQNNPNQNKIEQITQQKPSLQPEKNKLQLNPVKPSIQISQTTSQTLNSDSNIKKPVLSISVEKVSTKSNDQELADHTEPEKTSKLQEREKNIQSLRVDTILPPPNIARNAHAHTVSYTSTNPPANQYQDITSPKPSLATAASMSHDVVNSHGRRVSYQRRSSAQLSPEIQKSIDESNIIIQEQVNKIKHSFPEPINLEKEYKKMKKSQETKKEVSEYKPSNLTLFLPKNSSNERLSEIAKNEIFSELAKSTIDNTMFSSLDQIVEISEAQVINETEKTFLDRFSTDFSFFDFDKVTLDQRFDLYSLKNPSYSQCEFFTGYAEIAENLAQLGDGVTTIEDASKFIYYTASVFINGLNDNFITAYKELEERIDFIKKPLINASNYKNPLEQSSIFVQDLILSNEIIPFLYLLSNDISFISKHYNPYSLLMDEEYTLYVYTSIDRIMATNKFSFTPDAAKPINFHKELNPFIPYMLPQYQHSIDRFAKDFGGGEEMLKSFVKCVVSLIQSGHYNDDAWKFIEDVVKNNDYKEIKEWKGFVEAKNKFGYNILSHAKNLEDFVTIGVKSKVMHIWFTFMIISWQTSEQYYPDASIMRDYKRANHVVAVIEKVMSMVKTEDNHSDDISK
ncbi:hypothetical protein TVAG_462590 [Trichomonas vaginalis G3]|uniref:RUN domain-containing protein n=1 Tax=Trichomonas vaginalis (strain ATCC PRA-98 / G3) TaxID=412133 RepID=A2DLX0_TRIV3|nr:hypothetical protein TVAGG3_1012460 [Trichomonas vaginalis G3]EAY18573.1 hypothetical protein TVAG_462590 [Trichomonas vaginalis G3]KAI5491600.1 hypothetical protein TVAGG3_1012460 [Trichomonas vaginalis G3]|eukprot:XP_001579559.1 hypothetical protein [Trichomonas vaginalis G3]